MKNENHQLDSQDNKMNKINEYNNQKSTKQFINEIQEYLFESPINSKQNFNITICTFLTNFENYYKFGDWTLFWELQKN